MANGDPLPLPRSTEAVLGASAIPEPLLPDIPGLIPQAPVPDLPLPMFGALDAPPDLAGLLPVPQAQLAGAAPTFADLPAFPESPDLTPPPIVPPAVDAVGVAPAPAIAPETAGLPGPAPDLPAEFAPDIVGAPAVDASLAAVAELSDEQQAFRLRARDIQLELGAEADPVKRAALQAELADNVRAQQLAGSELGAARGIADEEVAVQSQGVEDQLRTGQRDAVLDIRTQAQEQATLDAAADERLRERQEVARVDQRAAKEQYTRIVRSGPQQPIAATIAASLTEALRAFSEDRPVNFDKALASMVAQSKESWQRQVDAASQDVQLTGNDITDLARQQSENKIQRAARDAAYAEEVMLGLDKEVAAAQDAQSQETAIRARDEWRRKRDALNAEAEAERAKRARADASRDLGDELTRAKIAKEQASAAKTQAEADKLARRGRGGAKGPKVEAGLFAANQVAFPGSDEIAVTFGGEKPTKADITEAKDARSILGFQQALLTRVSGLEATLEDAGTGGLFGARFDRSGEWTDLKSQVADLVPEIAKIGSGGFAATEADMAWARTNLPTVPNAWDTKKKALAIVRSLKRRIEDRTRQTVTSKTRIRPALAEQLVKRGRLAATSRKDVSRRLASEAEQIVVDEAKPDVVRLAAVDNIIENTRRDHGEDWLEPAAAQLSAAMGKTDNPAVQKRLAEKINQVERLARKRATQVERILTGRQVSASTGKFPTKLAQDPTIQSAERIRKTARKTARAAAGRQIDAALESDAAASIKALLGLDRDEDDTDGE